MCDAVAILVTTGVVAGAGTIITTISILLVWHNQRFKQIFLTQLFIIYVSENHFLKFWHQTK
jgi:hypothetical protein